MHISATGSLETIRRTLWIAYMLGSLACASSVDPTKFQDVTAAANALRADLNHGGADGSPQFDGLLQRFRSEISALEDRTSGRREGAVLDAYRRASENYQYFLRFKLLEREAVGGMVLLSGRNRPIASRYELPMDNRGGGRWVNRKEAMRVFSDLAEREITTAASLLSGKQ